MTDGVTLGRVRMVNGKPVVDVRIAWWAWPSLMWGAANDMIRVELRWLRPFVLVAFTVWGTVSMWSAMVKSQLFTREST
jgi:hypothetical protein